jgi:ACS family glucarate transporter-like MFS transporter
MHRLPEQEMDDMDAAGRTPAGARDAARSPAAPPSRPHRRHPVRVRWWIFSFMFAFAMLWYMQRTSVAVAAEQIMSALRLSQMQIAWLNAAFTTAYAAAQIPGGVLGQKLGARRTYVLAGILGLAATMATPLAPVVLDGTSLFVALLVAQALLGVAQAPVFPMLAAVIERWFPARQWAMTNGLSSAGLNLGGALTPFVIVFLTQSLGWQGALLSIALPTVLVTIGWGWYGRNRPSEHRAVTAEELAELGSEASEPDAPPTVRRLLRVLGDRNVLLLSFSYLCMNYVFYLLSFWSFLYLVQVRHFSGLESGLVGAIPWIGAGIGAACGGVVSDRLALRYGPRWGYRLVPLVTLPLAGVLLLVTINVATPYVAVATLAVAFCAIEFNEGAYWAAAMRVARADTAAATGVLNTGGNTGGIVTQPLVGALSAVGAWNGAFMTGTVFALVAAGCWLLIDAERPMVPAGAGGDPGAAPAP